MKILLTGASGFLGQHFKKRWKEKHTVFCLGKSKQNDIQKDLTEGVFKCNEYDMVVHTAGLAHMVPKTIEESQAFFKVNTEGTKNLLSSLVWSPPKRFAFISTVAVYGIDEGQNITESASLSGDSPYAKSKIEAEKIVEDWALKHHIDYLILRLPLISGHNPPGNLGAMANAIKKGYYFRFGNAIAKRSMVNAVDVANLIEQSEWKSGVYNLTDGHHPSIKETEEYIAQFFSKKVKSLPFWPIKIGAVIGDFIPEFPLNSLRLSKLQRTLTFSDSKAREQLKWQPNPALTGLSFEARK